MLPVDLPVRYAPRAGRNRLVNLYTDVNFQCDIYKSKIKIYACQLRESFSFLLHL